MLSSWCLFSFSRCLHTVSWQFDGEPKGKQRGTTFDYYILWVIIHKFLNSLSHIFPPSLYYSSWWRTCWPPCLPCSVRAGRPTAPSARPYRLLTSSCCPLGVASQCSRPSCPHWVLVCYSPGKIRTSAQAPRYWWKIWWGKNCLRYTDGKVRISSAVSLSFYPVYFFYCSF